MGAIQITPAIAYDWALVVWSLLAGMMGSFAALWLLFRARGSLWQKVCIRALASCTLGLSIGSLHYIGMFASTFGAQYFCIGGGQANNDWLAALVALLAAGLVAIVTVLLAYDGHLAAKTHAYNAQLEDANAQLQHAATRDSLTGLPNRI